MLLAALNPVLLQSLGMTLVDVPLGGLVVASWLMLGIALRRGTLGWVIGGALLGGLAGGLKLSNAFYAAAALLMLAFFPGSWQRRLQAAVIYGAACALAFVAVSAPWSYKLWQTFGNPLFPFLNTLPLPRLHLRDAELRALPTRDAVGVPARPFDCCRPMVHTRGRAPDLRYAALFVAMIGGGSPALRSSPTRAGALLRRVRARGRSARVLLGCARPP